MRSGLGFQLIAWALLAGGIAGCGKGAQIRLSPPAGADSSLVFGYFDMGEAPTHLGWVKVAYESGGASEELDFTVQDGIFYRENVSRGSLSVTAFGGSTGGKFISIPKLGLRSFVNFRYDIPPQSLGEFTIDTPGVYFLGAFRYLPVVAASMEASRGGVAGQAVFWKTTSFVDPLGERPFGEFRITRADAREVKAKVEKWAEGTRWHAMFEFMHAGGPGAAPRAAHDARNSERH